MITQVEGRLIEWATRVRGCAACSSDDVCMSHYRELQRMMSVQDRRPEDFESPRENPDGMLQDYGQGDFKGWVLARMLKNSIDVGAWVSYKDGNDYGAMVEDGLLVEVATRVYRLTATAIDLLFGVYGRA